MKERTPLFICDIDGTIADLTHRLHHIRGGESQDWNAFYEGCANDEPIDEVIKTIHLLERAGSEVWFFTGREGHPSVRAKTIKWLAEHLDYDEAYLQNRVVMRPVRDHRQDSLIKQEMLHNMLECDRKRLVGVFDDRQQVVDMWRENGVQCFQVAKGDF